MHALITTPNFLLLLNVTDRQVGVVESSRQEYYGISWANDERLALSHSGIDNASLTDLAGYALSEGGSISYGQWQSPRVLSAPHQMLLGSDGRIICTNTGRNAVLILNPDTPGHFQEVHLHPSRWDRLAADDQSGLHLNSLFEQDGVLYALAHGFDNGSRLFHLAYPSLSLLHEEELSSFTGMHNYCRTRTGEVISCASPDGALVDPHSGQCHWRSGTGGYLRGLAVGPDSLLVGESPRVNRADRPIARSIVWVIRRSDWQAIDAIDLGHYGVIHDIRLVDVPDEAHHGQSFPGIQALRSAVGFTSTGNHSRTGRSLLVATARLTQATKTSPYKVLLGCPQIRPSKWWEAGNELCLMVTRIPDPSFIGVAYDFSDATVATQCGLVFDYCPSLDESSRPARDSRMQAVLAIPISDGRVAFEHWAHDGQGWSCLARLGDEENLCGQLALERAGNVILVRAGAKLEVLTQFTGTTDTAPGLRWGIRWQATAILPVDQDTLPTPSQAQRTEALPATQKKKAVKKIAVFANGDPDDARRPGRHRLLRAVHHCHGREYRRLDIVIALEANAAEFTDVHALSLPTREYTWEILDAAASDRAAAYAGIRHTASCTHIVPNDGICHLADCDVWFFLKPPQAGTVLPLRPLVIASEHALSPSQQANGTEPIPTNTIPNAATLLTWRSFGQRDETVDLPCGKPQTVNLSVLLRPSPAPDEPRLTAELADTLYQIFDELP